ncbi:winged helix-turn-helix domain-containing protein [Nereida sp. MMG025]|uniref:winged helix-turn-helix domain-containing protein n=1 Tax=Nereida sp. MMG025 TaxID=2909981 RepID=UPI001F1C81D0|nr:crosslink repair DNA glycosylase YcaQ family protein [Nereida sp. MMG025]MCF6445012.1 winged helix DNA-binding domain-containing protein [Nereida sp. MMG025]
MTGALRIDNRTARALWLDVNGLSAAPTGASDVMGIIRALGMVQLDTIQVVARAHHHILWSRMNSYRERMFDPLLARDRTVFEHFTHDASILPMEFLPMWQRQFARKRAVWDAKGAPDAGLLRDVKARIADEGPLSTHAFDTKIDGPKEVWARPPHKKALDYLWYAGELATCHREKFTKFYDLAERVFPSQLWGQQTTDAEQVDWLCRAALERIGVGSVGEVQRFWEAMSAAEARAWAQGADLVPVQVQGADGSWTDAVALPGIAARLAQVTPPTSRLRIMNPFDPAIRDRVRLERLFGFDYRVEMFVPAAKRKWGYYVFPLLEGDRFVGRMEAKADRKAGVLRVTRLWPEAGVQWTVARQRKLEAEVDRMRRFVEVEALEWTA